MASLTGFPLCCGADILQNFSSSLDKSGVQNPQASQGFKTDKGGLNYEKDVAGNRIPITFADKFKQDFEAKRKTAPNRMYCCILNQKQYDAHSKGWPKLLKEMGFEFVRRWSNSVHDGSYNYYTNYTPEQRKAQGLPPENEVKKEHTLYLFVLCTATDGVSKDFTRPPDGWEELSSELTLVQKAVASVATAFKAA